MSKTQTEEGDPFIWPYRGGEVGPLGNSPADVRDQERLIHAVTETEVEHVNNNSRIKLYGYPGIVSELWVDLEDWE
jgi:hypothetical protein